MAEVDVLSPSVSGELEVRAVGPDDWELFRRVRLAALADAPEAFGSRYADWSQAGPERWRARLADVPLTLVLNLAGRPVGLVSGTGPADGVVELISLWVAPTARGRGIGDEAVRRVLDWASARGARQVRLSVKIGNAAALRLYERMGFEVTGPSPDDPTELAMTAELLGHSPG